MTQTFKIIELHIIHCKHEYGKITRNHNNGNCS